MPTKTEQHTPLYFEKVARYYVRPDAGRLWEVIGVLNDERIGPLYGKYPSKKEAMRIKKQLNDDLKAETPNA